MNYNRGYDHLNYRVGTLFEQIRKGLAYVRVLATGDVTIVSKLGGAIRLLTGTLEIDGRVVYTPPIIQSLGSGSTIQLLSSVVEISATDTVSLITTPTIAPGQEGEEILLINMGSNDITLSDESDLTGSSLRLESATITLTPFSSVRLRYIAVLSTWIQIAPVTNIL